MHIAWRKHQSGTRLPPTKALALLRKAVEADPDKPEIRLVLAQVLFECDCIGEIADLLSAKITEAPAPQADFHVGRAASHLGHFADAIPPLRRAADAGIARARGELATALWRSGDSEGALAVARAALETDPNDIAPLRVLGHILLAQGRAKDAYDRARSLWSRGAHGTQVVWTWAAAACALGREEEYRRLAAPQPWFAQTRLDIDNVALAKAILDNRALSASQSYKPAKGGVLRLDDFDSAEDRAAAAFHESLRGKISRYLADRAQLDHPLIVGRPEKMSLESWALVMDDNGVEDWHIHAAAWLSGVYYIRTPGTRAGAGNIAFGALPLAAKVARCTIPEWSVAPEPGTLLLFPSWFAHRTWPTGTADKRISIAFNTLAA